MLEKNPKKWKMTNLPSLERKSWSSRLQDLHTKWGWGGGGVTNVAYLMCGTTSKANHGQNNKQGGATRTLERYLKVW
jgi:hypothetical protein